MLKKVLFLVSLMVFSYHCLAQKLTKLTDDEAVTLSSLSRNGRFAFGVLEGSGVFMYDLSTKSMTFLEGEYYADGVSDNGIYVGSEKIITTVDGIDAVMELPTYFLRGECFRLPLPPAESNYTDGTARSINADGSLIVGYVSLLGNTDRVPCIWTLQPNQSYAIQLLPTLEKDFTDRLPQGIDALRCSDTGNVIVGRMIDWSGNFNLLLTWTKNAQQGWDLKEIGRDILFKEGSVLPSIPDPKEVNPMAYFTAEDSVTYSQKLQDYIDGKESESPEWSKQNYITNPDSIAKYNEAAAEYNAIMEVVSQKTMELFNCFTGKVIDVFSISISGNGKYVGTACSWADPEGGGDGPEPLMKGAKGNGMINAPLFLDLKTGKADVKDFVKDGIVDGVTNDGDLFFATPYMERTRTSFVIPAGTTNVVDVAQWVKQKTNGSIDMLPDFSFSYEYEDYMTGESVVVTDSLIVGDVIPSANGRILLGTFYSPIQEGPRIITYYVDMDNLLGGIENVANDATVAVYPNPTSDFMYIKGNVENVSIIDLTGRKVYESSSVSGPISVGAFGQGTYLVKVIADGKSTTHKISVKK